MDRRKQVEVAAVMGFVSSFLAEEGPFNVLGGGRRQKQPVVEKTCLQCGQSHSHNNSWCSSECCKLYRKENK